RGRGGVQVQGAGRRGEGLAGVFFLQAKAAQGDEARSRIDRQGTAPLEGQVLKERSCVRSRGPSETPADKRNQDPRHRSFALERADRPLPEKRPLSAVVRRRK